MFILNHSLQLAHNESPIRTPSKLVGSYRKGLTAFAVKKFFELSQTDSGNHISTVLYIRIFIIEKISLCELLYLKFFVQKIR